MSRRLADRFTPDQQHTIARLALGTDSAELAQQAYEANIARDPGADLIAAAAALAYLYRTTRRPTRADPFERIPQWT